MDAAAIALQYCCSLFTTLSLILALHHAIFVARKAIKFPPKSRISLAEQARSDRYHLRLNRRWVSTLRHTQIDLLKDIDRLQSEKDDLQSILESAIEEYADQIVDMRNEIARQQSALDAADSELKRREQKILTVMEENVRLAAETERWKVECGGIIRTARFERGMASKLHERCQRLVDERNGMETRVEEAEGRARVYELLVLRDVEEAGGMSGEECGVVGDEGEEGEWWEEVYRERLGESFFGEEEGKGGESGEEGGEGLEEESEEESRDEEDEESESEEDEELGYVDEYETGDEADVSGSD